MISGVSSFVAALGRRGTGEWTWPMIDGVLNILFGLAIALQWPVSGVVSIGLLVGLRCISAGWTALVGVPRPATAAAVDGDEMHPDVRLGLPPNPIIGELRTKLTAEQKVRSRNDRGWCWLFLLTFFVIHASRMDIDWNLVGVLSPIGAVVGDAMLAIVFAYALVAPVSVTWRALTRGLERRTWNWYLARADAGKTGGIRMRWARRWLTWRMRAAVRNREARGSPTAALGWGLRTGLPAAALLLALTPLWGVSWFFDTETWVTGGWEVYAEQRTDIWRVNMVRAVKQEYGELAHEPDFFRVFPDGAAEAKDFNFIVIGDTGEGDASQNILRDQLLLVGQKPEVKFLVVSSDVIYPSGAMKHYEGKFYLPFKGFHKPIYAVPGNHDWYDAGESFTANFFEPRAARAALRGRREADYKLTTTTEEKIDGMIEQAARLREAYGLQAAKQRAPYFEILTDRFSLIAVDTGILRRVDEDQMEWLEKALVRAGDRFKLVILGHPLYAAGHYRAQDEPDFAVVHALLKKHGANVVMAGDTHDFEFYKETPADGDGRSMYHFVNGGGGAYISIGTALAWPKRPPMEECGCYPRADAITASLEGDMPAWKQPLWQWLKRLDAWPSSVETLAAAFDYDRAPYFQSFMEVRVEGSTNTVRFWLHGVNGRLRWRDLFVQGDKIPGGQKADDLVEFAFPIRGQGR